MIHKFPLAHLVFSVFPFIVKRNKTKNPIVSAIPRCLPLCEIAQLRVMQIRMSPASEASYCTLIQGNVTSLWCICHQPRTGHKKIRTQAFLTTQPLACFPTAKPASFSAPHLIPATRPLHGLQLPSPRPPNFARSRRESLLLFTWGPEWLSPLETPERALAVSSGPTSVHLLDVEQFSLCLVKIFMIDSLFLFEFLAKTVTPVTPDCDSKFFIPTDFQSLKDLRPWFQILLFVQLFISYAVLFIPVAYANWTNWYKLEFCTF